METTQVSKQVVDELKQAILDNYDGVFIEGKKITKQSLHIGDNQIIDLATQIINKNYKICNELIKLIIDLNLEEYFYEKEDHTLTWIKIKEYMDLDLDEFDKQFLESWK